MNEIILAALGIIASIVTGLISWAKGRSKEKIELDKAKVDWERARVETNNQITEFYNNAFKGMNDRLTDLTANLKSDREKIEKLSIQVAKLSVNTCYRLGCEIRIRREKTYEENATVN